MKSSFSAVIIFIGLGAVCAKFDTNSKDKSNGLETSAVNNEVRKCIFGGKPKVIEGNQFPYQVVIWSKICDEWKLCGGSLISKQDILTAAHCVQNTKDIKLELTGLYNAGMLTAMDIGLRIINDPELTIHPAYDKNLLKNDVALIHLPLPVTENESFVPISLPKFDNNKNETQQEVLVTASEIVANNAYSHKTGCSTSNISKHSKCLESYPKYYDHDTNLCVFGSVGTSTCEGTSGGLIIGNENGIETLFGIISFENKYGCGNNLPIVSSRVSKYLDWIHSKIHK